MHVAGTNLSQTGYLEFQPIRSSRLHESVTVVNERHEETEDFATKQSDPGMAQQLKDVSKLQYALNSALKSNEEIESQYLLEQIY